MSLVNRPLDVLLLPYSDTSLTPKVVRIPRSTQVASGSIILQAHRLAPSFCIRHFKAELEVDEEEIVRGFFSYLRTSAYSITDDMAKDNTATVSRKHKRAATVYLPSLPDEEATQAYDRKGHRGTTDRGLGEDSSDGSTVTKCSFSNGEEVT